MNNQSASLTVGVSRFPPFLSIQVLNTGPTDLKIWFDSYSDGYEAPIIQIRDVSTGLDHFATRRRCDWTVNIGRYHGIAPRSALELQYTLSDGSWNWPAQIALSRRDLSLRVILIYAPSQDAANVGVFAGALASGWCRLDSPP